MKVIDIPNPERVNRTPDKFTILFSGENYHEHGFQIKSVELRVYFEKLDKNKGPYSLVTSFVNTNKGSVEMIYDEGYRGVSPLDLAKEFLIQSMGLSGLILRSIIALDSALEPS